MTGAGNDTINGSTGTDSVNAGADLINGLAGNDTYTVDAAGDILVEAAAGGTDTVRSSLASFTLADNLESLIHIGAGATAATGNAGDNNITGGLGNDTLNGAAGNDTLNGGNGSDTLIGAIDADRMFGGNGADVLSGDRFDFDSLAEITSDVITDFEAGAAGTDLIDLSTIDANGVTAGNGGFAAALRRTGQAFTVRSCEPAGLCWRDPTTDTTGGHPRGTRVQLIPAGGDPAPIEICPDCKLKNLPLFPLHTRSDQNGLVECNRCPGLKRTS